MWKTLTVAGMLVAGTAMAADKGEVPILRQWAGANAAQEKPRQAVVQDQKAWEEIWSAMEGNVLPKPETPKVDFDKTEIIAVFMGMRMSGGYGVKIVKIEEQDKKLVVTVKESGPPPGAMVTMALTSPYHVVAIAKSAKPVEFALEANDKKNK